MDYIALSHHNLCWLVGCGIDSHMGSGLLLLKQQIVSPQLLTQEVGVSTEVMVYSVWVCAGVNKHSRERLVSLNLKSGGFSFSRIKSLLSVSFLSVALADSLSRGLLACCFLEVIVKTKSCVLLQRTNSYYSYTDFPQTIFATQIFYNIRLPC